MRIHVTNDDGIESEGLHVLASYLVEAGYDVVVAAPDSDWSGAGAALGRISSDEKITVAPVEIDELPGVEAYAVGGPPALTAVAARLGAFGDPPDLVVSGINAGLNTGRSILHSGTVGAVLAAQNFGLSGLAVSIQSSAPWQWDTAAALAVEVLPRVIEAAPRSAVNLNVPALDREQVKGIRWARLATFGAVRAAVSGVTEGHLGFELVPTDYTPGADTDQGVVDAGYASLTTLVGVAEAWPTDAADALNATNATNATGGATGDATAVDTAVSFEERLVPGAPMHPVHRIPDASQRRALHRPAAANDPKTP